MKKVIYIFIFFIVTGCGNNSSSTNDKKEKRLSKIVKETRIDTLKIVQKIKRSCMKIDSLKQFLDSLSRDVYKSTEGGQIISFFKQSDTLKKEIVYYGETGKRTIELYYQEKNAPILIKDIEFGYKYPIYSSDSVIIKKKVLNEYYFKEKNLIYWVRNDSVMPSSKYLIEEKNIFVE